jgi:uncharacterized membrane protein YbhN (UPF0104 family)
VTAAVRTLARQAWFRATLGVGLLGLAAVAVWLRGPDWDSVYHAFDSVSWRWIALGVVVNLLSVASRAIAWHLVVNQALPEPHPRHRTVFSAFCVGLLANAVLPARAGEIARVAVLRRRLPHGPGTTATLVGTVFAHRHFDLFPVLLLIGYTLETAKIPDWALKSIEFFVAIGLTLLLVALVGARRQQRPVLDEMSPLRRLLAMGQRGLAVMKRPGAAAGATLFQTVGWTLQLLAVYVVMRGFDFGTLPAAALVLLLMNVATVFPFWPGNVGLLQAAIAFPLRQYGVAVGTGVAFGFVLQAVEMSVGVSLGLIFLAREGLSFGSLRSMRDEDEQAGDGAEAVPPARATEPQPVEEDEPARAGMSG